MTQSWNISSSRKVGGHWRIGYGHERDVPQCAALHLRDGYLRLAPHTGWGTSIVLPPSFWSRGRLSQGAPIEVQSSIQGQDLILAMTSCRRGLKTHLQVVVSPPQRGSMKVRVAAVTEGSIILDRRYGEAFKPVMLSSMQVNTRVWDASAVTVDDQVTPLLSMQAGARKDAWIVAPSGNLTRCFGLQGGTSQWKRNAPTIMVRLDTPLPVAGWRTCTSNPNDDNLALWAASSQILPKWSYEITAQL